MINDISAQNLHDQATRGGVLTEAERTVLEAWYDRQDRAESALLGSSVPESFTTLNTLRDQIEAALTRLREETRRLQTQEDENERLRRENAALLQQLTQETQTASGRAA